MAKFILGPYYLKTKIGKLSNATITNMCGFVSGKSDYVGGATGYGFGSVDVTTTQTNSNMLSINPVFTTASLSDGGSLTYLAGGANGATHLKIYSGTRPTISSLTSLAAYDNSLLIDFPIPQFGGNGAGGMKFLRGHVSTSTAPNISKTNGKHYDGFSVILGVCPTKVAAIRSGTPTWFWFGNNNSPTNLSGVAFVTGDVGPSGDLKIDGSIVSGESYYSLGFKLDIPAFYTV